MAGYPKPDDYYFYDPLVSRSTTEFNQLKAMFEQVRFEREKLYREQIAWHQQQQPYYGALSHWGSGIGQFIPDPEPNWAEHAQFEMNLMEALEGWKTWVLQDGKLKSASKTGYQWLPNEPHKAICADSKHIGFESPMEKCSCGIYAADDFKGAEEYISKYTKGVFIYGKVRGWGKYVRGDKGWRSQYAYPKSFHLHGIVSPDELEYLQSFRVPIFVDQPQLLYNPEEDGYEYGEDDEDRHFRTGSIADAKEDRSSSEDAGNS